MDVKREVMKRKREAHDDDDVKILSSPVKRAKRACIKKTDRKKQTDKIANVKQKIKAPIKVKKPISPVKKKTVKNKDDDDDEIAIVYEQITILLNESRRWTSEDVVSESTNVNSKIVQTVLHLFDQDCTIPFIARYRKEMTGGMEAEQLREVHNAYQNIKAVEKKVECVAKQLMKEKKLNKEITVALSNATSLTEIEHLVAPLKLSSRRSLAEKAKKLGLEESALKILNNDLNFQNIQPENFVKMDTKGLETTEEVLLGWQHIMADVIAKNTKIIDFFHSLCKLNYSVTLNACQSVVAQKKDAESSKEGKPTENFKFENYYSFQIPVANVKPHQVLALNRGEHLKILSVKIIIPPFIKNSTIEFCEKNYPIQTADFVLTDLMKKTMEDSYTRLLEPLICRQIRTSLTKTAEEESVKVFCSNLKQLLLSPPVRGKVVLGIDPGFTHGCKLAVVSQKGEVLITEVLYLHGRNSLSHHKMAHTLKDILLTFNCELIALGNGTACRETELFLSDLIKANYFKPLDLKYCIINESGVSIYSVTKEAATELPNLDPNLRSAVALARRLQDPLLEYVKIEPKHLGVGMYQHDISETLLKSALDEVMIECVSFVGADLNVSSEVVLRKIAGLTQTKARNIVEWREQNGSFKNRQQLLLVKGIGPKCFEQCAGFVKIIPQTSFDNFSLSSKPVTKAKGKTKPIAESPNPLDMTVVHPESYHIAEKFLDFVKASHATIGQVETINLVKNTLQSHSVEGLATKFEVPLSTMQLITDALQQIVEYDIRTELEEPLFKTGVASMDELKIGQIITGRVSNTTHFGAFVDVGIGQDGLIHTSKMRGKTLALGDRVTVKVVNIVIEKKRLSLEIHLTERQHTSRIQQEVKTVVSKHRNETFERDSNESKSLLNRNPIYPPVENRNQLKSLKPMEEWIGIVRNVVPYGVFVDLGMGKTGLLHNSQMHGQSLNKDQRITVKILTVDLERNRISLKLLNIL